MGLCWLFAQVPFNQQWLTVVGLALDLLGFVLLAWVLVGESRMRRRERMLLRAAAILNEVQRGLSHGSLKLDPSIQTYKNPGNGESFRYEDLITLARIDEP